MVEMLQMAFFGVLACSTLVATCLMAINFPRIRANNQAMMMALRGIVDTNQLGFEALTIELNKLEERVKELERA